MTKTRRYHSQGHTARLMLAMRGGMVYIACGATATLAAIPVHDVVWQDLFEGTEATEGSLLGALNFRQKANLIPVRQVALPGRLDADVR